MACWGSDPHRRSSEDGFATPAAAVVSLGLAVVASAVTGLAVADLRASQADANKTRAEYRLDGLQERASLSVETDQKSVRLRWTLPSGGGSAQVLAEAEGGKLGLQDVQALDGSTLQRLQVSDPVALRQRLQVLTSDLAVGEGLDNADASPLWRSCARSLVSVYGTAKVRPILKSTSPQPSGVVSRIGEVWRVRVVADGWADDRIVRFTGSPLHPASVIDRRFYRRGDKGDTCDALFATR